MAFYTYKASDRFGKVIDGSMEARDKATLVSRLRQSGYYPIKIFEGEQSKPFSLPTEVSFGSVFNRISNKDIMTFTTQLATLINAGLTLDQCLTTLAEMMENVKLKSLVETIQKAVHSGSSFADALAKHPKIFSKLYVNMIKAGEAGGVLESVLERLSNFLEESQKLKESIVSALIYPILLTFVGGAAVVVLMVFVIPKFAQIFTDMGKGLPLPTQILLDVSTFISSYWWLALGIIIISYLGFNFYVNTEDGRYNWDALKLKIPLVRSLIQKIEVSRFARTFGTLIKSGVPLLQALVIVREVINNKVISNSLAEIQKGIREGDGVAGPLRKAGYFPLLAIHMITIGEESGQLDTMLYKVAGVYDNEVGNTVKRLISFLEPAMILFMGVVVGGIVLCLMLAVFGLTDMGF